jgi:hypothetical protein
MSTDRKYHVSGIIQEDGSIMLEHFEAYKSIFVRAKMVGERVILVIQKFRRRRTDKQNRYIWGVAVPVVQYHVYRTEGLKLTEDEAYIWIRIKTGDKPEIKNIAGVDVVTFANKRLSRRNTVEFAETIDNLALVLAEGGTVLPMPKEDNLLHEFVIDE